MSIKNIHILFFVYVLPETKQQVILAVLKDGENLFAQKNENRFLENFFVHQKETELKLENEDGDVFFLCVYHNECLEINVESTEELLFFVKEDNSFNEEMPKFITITTINSLVEAEFVFKPRISTFKELEKTLTEWNLYFHEIDEETDIASECKDKDSFLANCHEVEEEPNCSYCFEKQKEKIYLKIETETDSEPLFETKASSLFETETVQCGFDGYSREEDDAIFYEVETETNELEKEKEENELLINTSTKTHLVTEVNSVLLNNPFERDVPEKEKVSLSETPKIKKETKSKVFSVLGILLSFVLLLAITFFLLGIHFTASNNNKKKELRKTRVSFLSKGC